MEIPEPGIESEPMPQLRQYWKLNPLPWAGDRTHTITDTTPDP